METAPTYPTRSRLTLRRRRHCTCLTKEYTSDGSVVFKDVCTKEMAVYRKADDD